MRTKRQIITLSVKDSYYHDTQVELVKGIIIWVTHISFNTHESEDRILTEYYNEFTYYPSTVNKKCLNRILAVLASLDIPIETKITYETI